MHDLLSLELVVVLGIVVLTASVLAKRSRIPSPILLLTGGVLLGLVPALRQVHLPPELLLIVLLPALLWWESLTTSLREIRRNLRGIVLTGSLLVIVTAAAVALTGHALGLAWGPAWVLGAALAPTDATAVGVLARSLPRRNVTLLRAESLVNDGTALVLYGVAVGVTVGEEHLSVAHVSWLFALSYIGGILTGLLAGWLGEQVRRRLNDALLENLVFLLTPFVAYLGAELLHASGVLAVVVAGLLMSQTGPRSGRADMRQQAVAFWELATFLVNGVLFVLVGLELHAAVRDLSSVSLARAIATTAAVTLVLVLTRFVFLFVSAHLIRLVDRRPQQRLRRVSERARIVSTAAGFRGAVSMAVALAVPQVLFSGQAFPGRDLLIFTTAGVIAFTLIVQAPLLPVIVGWAQLPPDTSVQAELHLAETTATRNVLRDLPALAAELGSEDKLITKLRQEQEFHLQVLQRSAARESEEQNAGQNAVHDAVQDQDVLPKAQRQRDLRLAVLRHKRGTVLALRDEGRIDDTVLRRLQTRLDDEELRLSRQEE